MNNTILTKEVLGAIDKLHSISDELKEFIVEKEEMLHIIKLALVSQKNAFFLGATGQSKSFTIREFTKRITKAKYYEKLMDKQSDKTEIFGKISIPELQKGREIYVKKNKLSEAHIATLDEFWKSGDTLLNTLLKVLNREEITLGEEVIKPPLISVFTASNEIPNFKKKEEEILYPLYNRLHLKLVTKYIEKKDNFKFAARAKRARKANQIKATISLDELIMLGEKAWEVEVPDHIDDLLWDICTAIKTELNRDVSDRKKIEYSIICQANALLNKRDTVIPEDLIVLKYYLWELPEEYQKIEEIITRYAENPLKDEIMNIKETALEIIDDSISNIEELNIRQKHKAFNKAENELFTLHNTLIELKEKANSIKDEKLIEETENQLQELYDKLNKEFKFTPMSIEEGKARKGF